MAVVDYDPGYLTVVADPGTPEWYRDRLLKALDRRDKDVCLLERYYDGEHSLPPVPDRMQRYQEARYAFENLSRLGVTNYMAPIPDAKRDRLTVIGFRFGEPENFADDVDAWRIWQRNHLDADAGLLHHDALVTGQSFALVWPENGLASITIEHPAHAIIAYVPGSRRLRAAGLKRWCEDDGTLRIVLYLPDEVYKWRTERPVDENQPRPPLVQWQPSTDETWPITNPLRVVPLVEFRANPGSRPAPFGGGRSELSDGVRIIQDRINKTVFDRLVTAEFQAFRQRWAVGWTPDDPNEAMKASMGNLWTFDDPNTRVGDFSQADFTPFLSAVSADVEALGAVTSTPFYALGKLANPPSGDALMALQSGLVSKTEAHRDNFTESHEEVLGIALGVEGNRRSSDTQTQVQWADIAHHTWAEKADAAVKIKSVGVPDEAVWQMLGYTNQDIERFKVMQADAALFAPAVPVAGQ